MREALARFAAGNDPKFASRRRLADQHQLLPVYHDWSGFVGLRVDGELFFVSEDDGSVSPDIDE